MDKYISVSKGIISAGFVSVASALNKIPLIIILYVIALALDLLTGFTKASLNKQVRSSVIFKGLIKKAMSFIVMGISFLVGFAIVEIGVFVSINLSFAINIGFYATAVMLLNEFVSVLENLYAIIPDKIPVWLIKILKIAENVTSDKIKGFICKNQDCEICEFKEKCENKGIINK